jgi:hypothetical protein
VPKFTNNASHLAIYIDREIPRRRAAWRYGTHSSGGAASTSFPFFGSFFVCMAYGQWTGEYWKVREKSTLKATKRRRTSVKHTTQSWWAVKGRWFVRFLEGTVVTNRLFDIDSDSLSMAQCPISVSWRSNRGILLFIVSNGHPYKIFTSPVGAITSTVSHKRLLHFSATV